MFHIIHNCIINKFDTSEYNGWSGYTLNLYLMSFIIL